MNLKPFDVIIFDLGSTLLYFDGDWAEALPRADQALFNSLERAGLQLDQAFTSALRNRLEFYYRERENEFIEHTTQYILRNLLDEWGYPYVPKQVLRQAIADLHAVTQAHWQLEADAIPTLQALQARGYHLGMISNASDDADVQKLVDKAGVRPYFEIILTSAAEGIRKPNPVIFQKILDHFEVPPKRTAMVGDTLGADILGARNAGIFSIWITRRADTPTNHVHADTIKPDRTIAMLSELVELLDSFDHPDNLP